MSNISNLLSLTIKEVSEKLHKKEVSPLELVQAYIESSKVAKPLNIYITETYDLAIEQAKESEKRYIKGAPLSPIDGIPVGVKDNYLTKGVRATNASKFLENFVAPYESTVTQNLLNAGYIHMGKLNMDEFAMGSSNISSYFGPVINPWMAEDGKERVPGGSSGGSAAGVAARSFLAALGSDTGGSIRQPSSFCGLVGIKPTYGTCSRYGIMAFASSLDQAGSIARTVEDNAMLLQQMAGYDEKDSSMIKFDKPNYAELIGQSIKGLKIGIPKEYNSDGLSEEVKSIWHNSIDILKSEGAEIVNISLPHTKYALAVYYIVSPVEASSNLARFDGIRYGNRSDGDTLEDVYRKSKSNNWGEEVKRRVILGVNNIVSDNIDNYLRAAKVRKLIAQDFINAFKDIDVILAPTAPTEAFPIKEKPTDPVQMYLSDIFTVTASLAGVPSLSVPVGLSELGLPIGMQLIGRYRNEKTLYQTAYVLEKNAGLKNILPKFVQDNNLL